VVHALVIELARVGSNRNARSGSALNHCGFSYLPRKWSVEA
jgi:hypothetical protein